MPITIRAPGENFGRPFLGYSGACQGRSKRGSSSHLMKNGQNFGILVLIWDLSGIDDTKT